MAETIKVTAQTKSAGRGQSIGGLANAWSNPNNIAASDNADASVGSATSGASDELWADSFNFALTSAVSVCGVRVNLEMGGFGIGTDTVGFRLILAGVEAGSVCARASASNSTDHIVSAGASGQTWGATLAKADVEVSGFGVSFNVNNTFGGAMNFDHVQMTVHYTVSLTLRVVNFDRGHEVQSVDTEKNLRVVGAEFSYAAAQSDTSSFDPESEFGHDVGSVDITSVHNIAAASFERGYEMASTIAYDSLIHVSRAEFDREWEGTRTFTTSNLGVASAEFDFEAANMEIRYFEPGHTPEDRTVPAQLLSKNRRIVGNGGDRLVRIHANARG